MKIVFHGVCEGTGTSTNLRFFHSVWNHTNIEPLIFCCDPSEFWHMAKLNHVLTDTGGQSSLHQRELIQTADLLILNTNQSSTGLEQFFQKYPLRSQRRMLFIGKFTPMETKKITHFCNLFKLSANDTAFIPYDTRIPFLLEKKSFTGKSDLRRGNQDGMHQLSCEINIAWESIQFIIRKLYEGEQLWKKFSNNTDRLLLQ